MQDVKMNLESCCGCAFTEHVALPGNTNNCESRSGTWHICCPLIVDSTLHQVTSLAEPRQNAGLGWKDYSIMYIVHCSSVKSKGAFMNKRLHCDYMCNIFKLLYI